jgi:hypothetical protein
VKHLLPKTWQSQVSYGTPEGLVIVVCAALLAAIVDRLVRRSAWYLGALAVPAFLAVLYTLLEPTTLAQTTLADQHEPDRDNSHTREVGLALSETIPEKSVLFDSVDFDPPDRYEMMALMFWSGRMTYRGPELLPVARAKGYHPYLISPASEPFAPVASVPPQAWLRAYDLDAPAPPPPLPAGVRSLDSHAGAFHILGIASGPIDSEHDRYAIYVHADNYAPALAVTFRLNEGTEDKSVALQQALQQPQKLLRASWFILPLIGPRAERVRDIQFDHSGPWLPLR